VPTGIEPSAIGAGNLEGGPPVTKKPSAARARILDAADRLFSAEGIRVVGVERLVKEADVSRLTFYRQFPSKDELVVAYLTRRSRAEQDRVAGFRTTHPDDPRAVMRAIVAAMRSDFSAPGFRGCRFINAAAEYSDLTSPVRQAVADHRAWYRETMRQLAFRIGVDDADAAADDLVLLRDGAMVSGYLGDADTAAAALIRAGRTVVARP
jgi:AcrR family transcriptional regulator